MKDCSFEITISGQVQGVGFRPFVYGLAKQFQLKGTVCNNAEGVLINFNCTEKIARAFLETLLQKAPSSSIIQSHTLSEVAFSKFGSFDIIASQTNQQVNTPLTPDFTICKFCKKEISDSSNRRHGYAFTTCTSCGPRFALTTKFPFERVNTTLASFNMCLSCQTEYSNPNDRRFHSQTNSCAVCGIKLKLTLQNGQPLNIDQTNILTTVSKLILEGNILAIKNPNGYLLCCDASNKTAIDRLRQKKKRPSKPFALLYPSIEKIKNDFEINLSEKKALTSPVGPIVILNPKKSLTGLEKELITSGVDQIGVMLPSSALLTLMMDQLKIPIIATSGNIHGSPIISTENEAILKLSIVADYFLHHDLRTSFAQDDSVLRFKNNHQITLRRARGLSPNYLNTIDFTQKKTLAMGAHLKSSFALVPNAQTYISPYFGNLDNYEVLERYGESIIAYITLFGTYPKTILIDKHPQYQSSILGRELAEKWDSNLISVQHHKAHFSSVLGEHDLFKTKTKILGVIWDGSGYGDDQAIWGGEFFSYQNQKIERITCFEYIDWIAADKMAKEPRISLLSILPISLRQNIKPKFSEIEWKVYNKMIENNTLKTSSVGRLFDAVSSILGILDITSFEGEAAMMLENEALKYKENDFIDFLEGVNYKTIPSRTILTNIHKAQKEGHSRPKIANSFIYTMANVIIKIAQENNYKTIACSGGVFQNAILIENLLKLSKKLKIKLKFNRILSSNDENISFGQLCYNQYIKN